MRLQDNGMSVALWLSARDTYDWAHRPGSSWPCSTLADRRVFCAFDRSGLVELAVDGNDAPDDLDAHELNALTSDFLARRLKPDHPCYFVTVGQFRSRT